MRLILIIPKNSLQLLQVAKNQSKTINTNPKQLKTQEPHPIIKDKRKASNSLFSHFSLVHGLKVHIYHQL